VLGSAAWQAGTQAGDVLVVLSCDEPLLKWRLK
jgi:hypothetical protein